MSTADPVQALIYLPHASRSVSKVREFRRCPEHDNLLTWEGRALGVEEFNQVAAKALGGNAVATYGMQPLVKLISVALPAAAVEAGPDKETLQPPAAKPVPVIEHLQVGVEPIADGFMLVNYSSAEAQYMGTARVWENEAGLVTPFSTEKEARSACPGVLVEKPAPAAVVELDKELDTAHETAPEGEAKAAAAGTTEKPMQPTAPKKRGRPAKTPEGEAKASAEV